MPNADLSATFESLKSIAATQISQYPQYKGHFTIYRLVRVKREVKTKMGLAFASGEYAIATPVRDELPNLPSSGRFVTVWSRRNKIDTSVRTTDVEWM